MAQQQHLGLGYFLRAGKMYCQCEILLRGAQMIITRISAALHVLRLELKLWLMFRAALYAGAAERDALHAGYSCGLRQLC